MSHFRKFSQTIWHCQYHVVFVPKYRFKIPVGEVAKEVEHCIRAFCEQQKGEIVELNVQIDTQETVTIQNGTRFSLGMAVLAIFYYLPLSCR